MARHLTPDQIERDHYRQEDLESPGWRVIRFTGKEIYHDPVRSTYRARRIITQALGRAT